MADLNGVGSGYEKGYIPPRAQNNVQHDSASSQEKTVAQKLNGFNPNGDAVFSAAEQKAAAKVMLDNVWANVIQSGAGPINLNFTNIESFLNFSDMDISNVTTAAQAEQVVNDFKKSASTKIGEAVGRFIEKYIKKDETVDLEKMHKVLEDLANNEPKKVEPQYAKTSGAYVDLETTTEGSAYRDFRESKPES